MNAAKHALSWENIAPGNYAVTIGDQQAFDVFHFRTERDADRFVTASQYAIARTRAR